MSLCPKGWKLRNVYCKVLVLSSILLVLLAACTSSSPQTPPDPSLSSEPQRYLLRSEDMPLGFRPVSAGFLDVSNQEACRSHGQESEIPTKSGEDKECLKRLEKWGRLGGYQVQFQRVEPLALLEGTFGVYNMAAVYGDEKGASEAFRFSRQSLARAASKGEEGVALMSGPKVGDEAVAYRRAVTESVNGREIAVSYYWLDFRRQNVLMRVATVGPAALAQSDDLARYARLLDERAANGGHRVEAMEPAGAEPSAR